MHRGRQSSGGLPPLLPVWVVHFPKMTTSRRPPEVGYDIRRLSLPVGLGLAHRQRRPESPRPRHSKERPAGLLGAGGWGLATDTVPGVGKSIITIMWPLAFFGDGAAGRCAGCNAPRARAALGARFTAPPTCALRRRHSSPSNSARPTAWMCPRARGVRASSAPLSDLPAPSDRHILQLLNRSHPATPPRYRCRHRRRRRPEWWPTCHFAQSFRPFWHAGPSVEPR